MNCVRMRYYTYFELHRILSVADVERYTFTLHRINKIKTAKQEEFFVLNINQRPLLYAIRFWSRRDLIFSFYFLTKEIIPELYTIDVGSKCCVKCVTAIDI